MLTTYLTVIGGLFLVWLVLVTLFTPHIPYQVDQPEDATSEHFVQILETTCQATLESGNSVEVFAGGAQFYPAMLDAIRSARESVNMECYIFHHGQIADQFIEALVERARAGVRVRMTLDAIGSLGTFRRAARPLREAGCRVEPYQRWAWYRLSRLNNRTHRELLVVDGRIAFAGGAGIADWWAKPHKGRPAWRDMMARIEGPAVPHLQSIFAENWLECCGEILAGPEIYKPEAQRGTSHALAVRSSPADRATPSRVLFQMLIESATRSVRVTSPYFLPDRAFRRALVRTAKRGVAITVVVPGRRTDQRWVRLASRRMYGPLLEAGITIVEYRPSMMHAKMLIVDELWSVIGSTNLDNRSFEHNDEMNVAIRDEAVAERLICDFERDLSHSREITLKGWKKRPMWEKTLDLVSWILERQQ